MMLRARSKAKEQGEKWAPPMHTWTPEVDALHKVLDELSMLRYTLVAVNSEKGKAGQPPKPHPRPRTAIERARMRAKMAAHEALVARVLPHKAKRSS